MIHGVCKAVLVYAKYIFGVYNCSTATTRPFCRLSQALGQTAERHYPVLRRLFLFVGSLFSAVKTHFFAYTAYTTAYTRYLVVLQYVTV